MPLPFLSARDLVKTYGERVVLAGVEEPDAGKVDRPPDTGFLRQELPFGGAARVLAEVSDTAAFVASDHAGAMTGTVANMTCGAIVD